MLTAQRIALPAAVVAVAAMAAAAVVPGHALLLWNVTWTAAATAALAGTLAARAAADPALRRRWTWLAAATACWLLGQVLWDLSLDVAHAGWWAFAVLVMAGLLAAVRTLRVVAILEGLPLIAAAMALICAELWDDATASALPAGEKVAALAYPVLYVSAAVLTLQAMIGGPLRAARGPGSQLVLAGVVAEAGAFIHWSSQLLADSYVPGATVVDPLWAVGMLAIAAGGLLTTLTPESAPGDDAGRLGGVLPATTFALLVAALVRGEIAGQALGARLSLVAGLLISGATLIGRGLLLERRLRRLNERLAEDSRHDALTGLLNRRALAEDMPMDDAEPIAVALCDVDCFKAYNDRLGHLAGDQALRALAGVVRRELRSADSAYRFGGEELLLVLHASPEEAVAVAERLRAAVAALRIPHPAGVGGILTVSIGVAAARAEAAELLAAADAALYEAKATGRDRVVAAGAESAPRPSRARLPIRDEPVLRHLRGALAISRAAAAGDVAVLQALAETIRAELRFETVAVNVLDPARDALDVVIVLGDEGARRALLGTSSPWSGWEELLVPEHDRCGAIWLPAGSHEFTDDVAVWTPPSAPALVPDAWDPEDMLLLPLRTPGGQVVAIVSVDQPLSGRRPDDGEISVLMALADHAALALAGERLAA